MSVEEDVNIRLLDPRALDAQGRKAVAEMEKIKKRLQKEAKEADDAVAKVKGAPDDLAKAEQSLQQAISKIPLGREAEVREQKRLGTLGITKGPLAQGITPAGRKDAFRELRDKVADLEDSGERFDESIDKLTSGLKDVEGLANNPIGFLTSKITGIIPSMLLKGGIIGTIVIAVGKAVLEQVKSTFAPGGINDIRKLTLDEASTIPDLANLVALRNGSVFFSADTRVRQRAVQTSNTENLSDQSQRFNELDLGGDLGVG